MDPHLLKRTVENILRGWEGEGRLGGGIKFARAHHLQRKAFPSHVGFISENVPQNCWRNMEFTILVGTSGFKGKNSEI